MKQLLDFIPLLIFFVAYKLAGFYVASVALMGATVIQFGILRVMQGHLERGQWITLGLVIVFCSMTLFLRNEAILKWKAPIANWVFGLIFLGSHFIGKQTLCERLMGHVVTVPKRIWAQLNLSWVAFFFVTGAANLYVAFKHHAIWVDFKVFGSLGLMLLFLVFQGVFLARHMKQPLHNALEPASAANDDQPNA